MGRVAGALIPGSVQIAQFCIQNDEFCIQNDEYCIQNDEFCRRVRLLLPAMATTAAQKTETATETAVAMAGTATRPRPRRAIRAPRQRTYPRRSLPRPIQEARAPAVRARMTSRSLPVCRAGGAISREKS